MLIDQSSKQMLTKEPGNLFSPSKIKEPSESKQLPKGKIDGLLCLCAEIEFCLVKPPRTLNLLLVIFYFYTVSYHQDLPPPLRPARHLSFPPSWVIFYPPFFTPNSLSVL